MADNDFNDLKKNIKDIYNRKRRAALAICLQYASIAAKYIKDAQASNRFWTNQTGSAKDLIFGGVIKSENEIGWFIAHGVSYGVYLEIANNRKNAVLLPTMARYYSRFIRDIQELYGVAS